MVREYPGGEQLVGLGTSSVENGAGLLASGLLCGKTEEAGRRCRTTDSGVEGLTREGKVKLGHAPYHGNGAVEGKVRVRAVTTPLDGT